MKNLIRTALIALAAALAASCGKEDTAESGYLPLTYYNLDGYWQLVQLDGGPVAEGTFAYFEFKREDHTFTKYSNIGTTPSVVSVRTGVYDIYEDDNAIGGKYDYELDPANMFWSHIYTVSEFTHDRMVWTAQDDESIVHIYTRIEALPEGLEK